jgi:outer membrane lipoprotein-sorting protein
MRTLCASITIGVLLCAPAVRADDAADAKAIVEKAIKATGGEEVLSKFKAMTWKEKGTYYGMGKPLPYTGKYSLQWPGKFRMEIEGVFTTVMDGDKGWIQANGETKEMTKEQIQGHKENLNADQTTRLLPLLTKEYTLSPAGEIKVNDKAAVGVKAARKDHGDVLLYFDKDSGLLAKMEYKVHSQEKGKEVKQETFFSDYKAADGMQVPRKIAMKQDGKDYVEAEILEPKLLDKIDPKLFEKP